MTREPFKHVGHRFKPVKGLPWPVCIGCGLVRLRNPITEWCVRHGCNHEDRPEYKSVLKQTTSEKR